MELTMRVGWFAEREDPDGYPRLVARDGARSREPEDVAALVVETEETRQVHRFENFLRYARSSRMPRPRPSDRARMPCIPVSPYAGEETETLEHLWAGIALTENETDVVEALRIVDPQISAVSMVIG